MKTAEMKPAALADTFQLAQNAAAKVYALASGKVPFNREAFEAAKTAENNAWRAHRVRVGHMFNGPSEAQALGFSALD